jgi:5'-3' exonuclease
VVQIYRRGGKIMDDEAVRRKFGVEPALMPDLLALVGDAADGYPGLPGLGPIGAARLLNRYGPIEHLPAGALEGRRELALLFKDLATLRSDAALFADVEELEWRGPGEDFPVWAERVGDPALVERADRALRKLSAREAGGPAPGAAEN